MRYGIGSVLVLEPDDRKRAEVTAQIIPLIGGRPVYTEARSVARPGPDMTFHVDLEDPQRMYEATEMVIGSSRAIKPFAAEVFRLSGIQVFTYVPSDTAIGNAWDRNERALVALLTPPNCPTPAPELWANRESAIMRLGELCRQRAFVVPEGPLDWEVNRYTGQGAMYFDDSGLPCRPEDVSTELVDSYGFEGPHMGHCIARFIRAARGKANRWAGVPKSAIKAMYEHAGGMPIDHWHYLSRLAYEGLIAVAWHTGEPVLFPTAELLSRRTAT